MITLETERCILRPFQESDLEDFYEYAKNPHIGPNAGWPPHSNKEDSRKILRDFMEGNEVWALVYQSNNKLIGSIGLHKDQLRSADDVKMLGYVLSEDYWGMGIMPEAAGAAINYAFRQLDVSYVTVHHFANNTRSKRVIEKLGFQYEGTLRHCSKIFNGTIHDLSVYSMSREEWQATH
jgi:[ribosomal protein S5]-alanine N-acetyltransferase